MAYGDYVPVSPSEDSVTKECLRDTSVDSSDTHWPLDSKRSRWHRLLLVSLAACCMIALYTWIVLHAASIWWEEKILHGAYVVDTPLRPWIKYQAQHFEHKHWAKDYPLVGYPSDELDARWTKLQKTFYTEVPAEYMQRMGRLDEGIQLENGNYAATYSVMHLLHCVQRIHQSYFSDRYFPNLTERESFLQLEHNLHCLQMLQQAVTCNADVVPITTVWKDNNPMPMGNFHVAHECVNWELLHEGMLTVRVDPWKEGTFVHPIFGEATHQKNEDGKLKDRIGFGEEGNVMLKGEDGKWIV